MRCIKKVLPIRSVVAVPGTLVGLTAGSTKLGGEFPRQFAFFASISATCTTAYIPLKSEHRCFSENDNERCHSMMQQVKCMSKYNVKAIIKNQRLSSLSTVVTVIKNRRLGRSCMLIKVKSVCDVLSIIIVVYSSCPLNVPIPDTLTPGTLQSFSGLLAMLTIRRATTPVQNALRQTMMESKVSTYLSPDFEQADG